MIARVLMCQLYSFSLYSNNTLAEGREKKTGVS